MSIQEIIAEIGKLDRKQIQEVDMHLHRLLEKSAEKKRWGEALLEVAGSVEGLPEDYSENHDHYLHGLPKR